MCRKIKRWSKAALLAADKLLYLLLTSCFTLLYLLLTSLTSASGALYTNALFCFLFFVFREHSVISFGLGIEVRFSI